MIGKVKLYKPAEGFGFIGTEAGDYFFHASQVIGTPPTRGDEVNFWLDDSRTRPGLIAVEVEVRGTFLCQTS